VLRGVVLRKAGGSWHVHVENDTVVSAVLRGRVKHAAGIKLAVGDEVLLRNEGSSWVIAEILPRRSQLVRRAPGGARGERVVVANVDQALVVFAAALPDPNLRMLDRFLVVAEASGVAARIVVNKIDLVDPEDVRRQFALYEAIGYPLHFTSCRLGIGLDELRRALEGRTSALMGPSGVGKSSLMNAMYPGLNLRVGEVSSSLGKGRHTTVGAYLHPLPGGGYVADTPGLREIGLWGLPPTALDTCFPEMRPYLDRCRFPDCRHNTEPGCAVREAVGSGAIAIARYESYRKLLDEVLAAEREKYD
jgi:ribosome biogenesis GTPase